MTFSGLKCKHWTNMTTMEKNNNLEDVSRIKMVILNWLVIFSDLNSTSFFYTPPKRKKHLDEHLIFRWKKWVTFHHCHTVLVCWRPSSITKNAMMLGPHRLAQHHHPHTGVRSLLGCPGFRKWMDQWLGNWGFVATSKRGIAWGRTPLFLLGCLVLWHLGSMDCFPPIFLSYKSRK